jgi:gluconate 2-dehydrogenase gamma chain
MPDLNRRQAVQLLASLPLAAAIGATPDSLDRLQRLAREAHALGVAGGPAYEPKFLTPHEYQTVTLLADLIIPRDERSGSASEAGVPEFIDYVLTEYPDQQTPVRGGLAWLDLESKRRWSADFVAATAAQRTGILDDIAWPKKARPDMGHGVAFFNRMRDLTASGFFSSRMGVDDLRYTGNTFVAEWKGCPSEVLGRLGVSYE